MRQNRFGSRSGESEVEMRRHSMEIHESYGVWWSSRSTREDCDTPLLSSFLVRKSRDMTYTPIPGSTAPPPSPTDLSPHAPSRSTSILYILPNSRREDPEWHQQCRHPPGRRGRGRSECLCGVIREYEEKRKGQTGGEHIVITLHIMEYIESCSRMPLTLDRQ